MLNRLPILAFILMLSFSIRFQDRGSFPASGKQAKVPTGPDRTALILFAKQYLGTPYLRASMNPKKGFDCSGFVSFVFQEFHVDLPRSAGEYRSFGEALKPEEFRVGDVLVFYGFRDRTIIGHVGIICEANGMKSRFIHASSGKAHSVTISDLDSEGYHRRFYKCIDVLK
jgi:cell wall-associated NlpC family hydrolase